MKLPFLEKKENAEYYLALVLRNEKVTSVIFKKLGSTIKYISHGEEEFKNTIEDAQTEEFLNVLDKTITEAESALPESIETHKTIFGLKESWIEDNKIKKEYLEKLKKASDELSLDPIGFLIFAESIINLVQKDEGAPVTAVLADIGRKFITVSLIKSGRLIETKSSEIHQSASFTVDTLLKHFQTPEVMPARIILFDSEEDELTQEFINHQWSKSLPFLHLPQIVSLPADASIKAMLLGAATQMGTKLLYDSTSIDMDVNEAPKKIFPDEFTENKPLEQPAEEPAVKEEEMVEEPSFVKASEEQEIKPKTTAPLDYVSHDNSLEYFGFIEGTDVAKVKTPEPLIEEEPVPQEIIEEATDEIPEETKIETEKKTAIPAIAVQMIEKVKKTTGTVLESFKKINFKDFKNKKLLIIAGIVVILLIAFLGLFSMNSKATISILINPKQDSKTVSVTFSASSPTDIPNSVLAFETVSISEDGTVTEKATGKKDIGTPAKGKVTIFNISGNSTTFNSGTTITSPNGLKFTLDNSVTVASGSADPLNPVAATASVNVTAGDIGQEYNLPSGTKFSVSGSDSSVAAKNDNAFSGGTKKSVTVISKDDIQKALDDLPKQLEEKAKNDIGSKVTDGKTLLPSFIDENVDKQNFDKKANDQANQVTLTGTVTFKGVSYANSDMTKLANSLFNSGDTQLNQNNLSVTAKNIIVAKNSDVSADLTIKADLVPKIDTQSLTKQIAGGSLQKAKNLISNLPQVENVGIVLNPNLPFFPKNLPGNPKNITINVTSK